MLHRRVIAVILLSSANLLAADGTLQWQAGTGHRFAEVSPAPSRAAGFTSLPPAATGILFTNVLTEERGITNQIYMSGSGVALGDVDGDGWVDIYLCGLDSPNKMFRNLGGWRFQDITPEAGVACPGQASTGAVLADVDGDGDLDLLVNGIGHGTRLFLNDGHGRFQEATVAAGLTGAAASMSMALADIDGDGDLDLYVTNYRTDTLQDEPGLQFNVFRTNNEVRITMVDGHPVTEAERHRYYVAPGTMSIRENGEADVLYRNDGRGHFTPVPWTAGAFLDEEGQPGATPYDWGLSVMFRDINGDGAPDLYVCNDADSPDRIWINRGDGRFQALPRLALRETCFSSMGVDFADLNRDGFDEFIVVDMLSREHRQRHQLLPTRHGFHPVGVIDDRPQYGRNMLYLNRGDGTYAELAQLSGVDASDWSWMPLFLDVDLDGYEDLLIATGLERSLRDADSRRRIDAIKAQRKLGKREFLELRKMMLRLETPNFAFRNRGDLTFEDASVAWGFDSRAVSQGMALADLDNDGDLDVVVNCLNGPALVYRNKTAEPRVAVRLKGNGKNTRGIGAKIRFTGGPVPQSQEMISGGRYLSGDDAMRVFAAGHSTNRLSVDVTWRSGRHSVVSRAKSNCIYEIDETDAAAAPSVSPVPRLRPLFTEVSSLLNHVHHETVFRDVERQPLLPRMLSQLGPGVCWCDFNADGREDLIVGCGRGGQLSAFTNTGAGGFHLVSLTGLPEAMAGDTTTILSVPSLAGSRLLFGVSNYETGSTNQPSVRQFEIRGTTVTKEFSLPGIESSAGPMALADVDGDGRLDLFVGGRVLPGRYPEAAASRFYRGTVGGYTLDEAAVRLFEKLGLISAAVFTDLDGDGFPELVVACEWGPLKIFRNDHGNFAPWNPRVTQPSAVYHAETLNELTGWWNSVAAGDFDGDGRMDLVAGNWGRNTPYQYYLGQPLRIYFGDVNGTDRIELIEAHYDPTLHKLVPRHHWDALTRMMPFMLERFGNCAAYCETGVAELLGDRSKAVHELTASTLDTMVFLNRGDHFESMPLPLAAQLAPVFGLCVADLDGDGREDIFLAQNFFDIDMETSRYDAGRGLLLKGDGRGGFTAVPEVESGVVIYGEQRGAAVGDYDGDGRVDLVVSQNGATTKLFHNEGAKPGLRLRLRGPVENAAGIGAVVRLIFGERMGAAREIHAGAGYWSQDSLSPVLATPEPPTQIWIRWPGGKVTTSVCPKAVTDVAVDSDGKVTVLR